jgi:hypothetical protein
MNKPRKPRYLRVANWRANMRRAEPILRSLDKQFKSVSVRNPFMPRDRQ